MSEQDQPVVEPFGFLAPLPTPVPTPPPTPDETWSLPGGTAWVYYGEDRTFTVRPVILADGFNTGPSSLDALWEGLERGDYQFPSQLRASGRTLVLVGFEERSASILTNADAMIAAIMRARAEQIGDNPMVAGGFSMGGLVARYALAKMEADGIDHGVGVYLSYDSPHRGAWVPIALQNLAHFLTAVPALSAQINSPASRQLLWRHVESVGAEPRVDPLREQFLEELARVGGWPRIPRLLGVANGVGTGKGNGVPAGQSALTVDSGWFTGTDLKTQAGGQAHVARLKGLLSEHDITTSGLPELDGAPGGTLETFGIAGDKLKLTGAVTIAHRTIGFVPTVSAVAIRDLDDPYTVVDELSPDQSELDDFFTSGQNESHTKITAKLAEWILERLPE